MPEGAIIVSTRVKGPGTFTQQLPVFASVLSQPTLTGAVFGSNY
jgi:hypothetical protein